MKEPSMSTALDTTRYTARYNARLAASTWMQRLVPELVALTLDAKQAHWNVTGPAFLPLHALTDEIAADARNWTDRVAERALALGFTVDARAATVASVAGEFPAGQLSDREVIGELTLSIDRAADTARSSLGDLETTDAVAHDITVEVLEGLEKYRWMLTAQKT
jgi:starvation-inducible DNA-binding protein